MRNIIIHLVLRDQKTKEKWQTPNHNEDKKLDDFHGPDGVKEQILSDVTKDIKKKFGDNCDIQIKEGKIIVVSQKFDKTGKKSKIKEPTNLEAKDYFDKMTKMLLISIIENTPVGRIKLLVFEEISNENEFLVVLRIEYRVK